MSNQDGVKTTMSLFMKEPCAKHLTVLQQYNDKTQKMVWFNSRTKQICMGKTIDANRLGDGASGCSMALSMSKYDFIQLLNTLDSVKLDDPDLFHVVCERTNYKKQLTKLVITHVGERNIPAIVRLFAEKEYDDDIPVLDDPDPLADDVENDDPNASLTTTKSWEEEFGKFYISLKDDWAKMKKAFRTFFHESARSGNVFTDEELATNETQFLPRKRPLDGKKKEGGRKKKPKNAILIPDEQVITHDDRLDALSVLMAYMNKTECRSVRECCLNYTEEMVKSYKNFVKKRQKTAKKIDFVLDIYNFYGEECLTNLFARNLVLNKQLKLSCKLIYNGKIHI